MSTRILSAPGNDRIWPKEAILLTIQRLAEALSRPQEKCDDKIRYRHFPAGGRFATLSACAVGLVGVGSPVPPPADA